MSRVCVVGAGAAGLCAARHLLAEPGVSEVDILEQADQLGGTWVYTEKTGYDDFGLPIHTSMYKSLRTNLPKEIMGFPDFPVPESEKSYLPAKEMLAFLQLYADKNNVTPHIKVTTWRDKSYLPAKEMLAFLQLYADKNNATPHIKFRHHVQLVIPKPKPNGGELWDVTYKSIATGISETKEYDYVFVCNGHYNTPFIPDIEGLKEFEGDVLHSHDYRVPDVFAGKRVLVVGAGPSGMDIALEISAVTPRVILSHHLKEAPRTVFPDNLVQKGDVTRLCGRTAEFADGSREEVDVLFLCTGYLYNFPFLHASCGVRVEENCVEPLYKHLVNIQHPSMCFIGVPYYVCAFSMFDLQVRYYVRWMRGVFALPAASAMAAALEQEMRERAARGYTRRQAHMMGPDQEKYYASLATEAGIENLPSVITKIREESSIRFLHNLKNYRQDIYKIIDDDTYEIISNGKREVIC